jgi:flavin reductase (DIM6/NTAB) family NADH-FMN oxidoreductase RutF
MAALDPSLPLRRALGRFPTGVALVATRDGRGGLHAMVINSVCSVSLTPPLLMWCCAQGSRRLAVFEAADTFSVNVLGRNARELCDAFLKDPAASARHGDWTSGLTGAPMLMSALAALECKIRQRSDLGDHRAFLGEVVNHLTSPGDPLVFHDGALGHLDPWSFSPRCSRAHERRGVSGLFDERDGP